MASLSTKEASADSSMEDGRMKGGGRGRLGRME